MIAFEDDFGGFHTTTIKDHLTNPLETLRFDFDEDGVGAVVRITDGNGKSAEINLSKAETLGDVIDLINAADLAIDVGYDVRGTGLRIASKEGVSGPLKIEDVKLSFAGSLGIAGQGVEINSDNLQKQYVSENTLLGDLNAGLGIARGKFRITDSSGRSEIVNLTSPTITTIGDVIAEINRTGLTVRASINETGDGILIADDSGVHSRLKIEDLEGGNAAHDLHLAGDTEEGRIDGSFELKIELQGGETAQELVDLINERSTLARANIFNDGRDVNPFRLTVSSRATGMVGEMILDGGELGLDFTTLTRASDAVVVIGDDPQNGGIRVRSSSNTITDVIPGLTLNLNSASDDAVTVTVDQSMQTALSALQGLVADYNTAMDRIDQLTAYDPETERAGILLGDSAAAAIERRLTRMVALRIPGARGKYTRLSDLGIRIGDGARLKFDETKFTDAFQDDPEGVIRFFTDLETGA
ncbi:MAG: flagellar filament capping protein FliD, partial [Chloroflexi bacterium]|nr:flagellar filament capping protein FliD [Chloroflexota bacterium]